MEIKRSVQVQSGLLSTLVGAEAEAEGATELIVDDTATVLVLDAAGEMVDEGCESRKRQLVRRLRRAKGGRQLTAPVRM